jgi:hypothetical protein
MGLGPLPVPLPRLLVWVLSDPALPRSTTVDSEATAAAPPGAEDVESGAMSLQGIQQGTHTPVGGRGLIVCSSKHIHCTQRAIATYLVRSDVPLALLGAGVPLSASGMMIKGGVTAPEPSGVWARHLNAGAWCEWVIWHRDIVVPEAGSHLSAPLRVQSSRITRGC